jgi:hypothetical protein
MQEQVVERDLILQGSGPISDLQPYEEKFNPSQIERL